MNTPLENAVQERPATYALVVGIDEYAGSEKWRLNGPGNDALRFVDWLRRKHGVPARNINLLLSPCAEDRERMDRQATDLGVEIGYASQNNIRQILEASLPHVAEQPDLCFYLYWAGHGAVSVNEQEVHYIHCADSGPAPIVALSVDEVLRLLRSPLLSQFCKQVCVFDTCAPYRTKKDGVFSYTRLAPKDADPQVEQFTMLAARYGEWARTRALEGKGLFSEVLFEWLADHPNIEPVALFEYVDARFEAHRQQGRTKQHPILCQWNGAHLQQHRSRFPNARGYSQPVARKQQISFAWECAAQEFDTVFGLTDDIIDRMLAFDLPGLPVRVAMQGARKDQSEPIGHFERIKALAQRLHEMHNGGQQAAFVQCVKTAGIHEDCENGLHDLIKSAAHAENWAELVEHALDHYLGKPENRGVDPVRLIQTQFAAIYPRDQVQERPLPNNVDEALFRSMQCSQPDAAAGVAERLLVRLAWKLDEPELTQAVKSLDEHRYRRIVNEIENEIDVDIVLSRPTHLLIDFNVDEAGRLPETVDYWHVDIARPHLLIKNSFKIGRDMSEFLKQLDIQLDTIGGDEGVIVEIFLPFQQLGQSPDAWLLPGPQFSRRPLGKKVPLAVRWRERAMGLPFTGGLEWRLAGGRLAEGKGSIKTCWVRRDDKPDAVIARFCAKDATYCCGFDFPPLEAGSPPAITAHLGTPIYSGMPFACWPREAPVSEDFTKLVEALLEESPARVPGTLLERRQTSSPEKDPDFLHMTLFWDDPRRNPLGAQLSETKQRDTP
nr:hypothetical protein HUO10_005763 [Paraburkholderia busanensis]